MKNGYSIFRLVALVAALLVACMSVLLLYGCKKSIVPDYFSYQSSDFTAEIRGTLNGTVFGAVIKSEVLSTGERLLHISYLSPQSLANVELECYPDGSVQILCNDLSVSADRTQVSDLLLPIDLLLSDGEEVVAVQKNHGLTLLTLPEECSLTLSQNGTPVAASSPQCSFDVVWWE